MLAPTLTETAPLRAPANTHARPLALDAIVLVVALTAAGIWFFEGGFEALLGSVIGAVLGVASSRWTNDRAPAALSGASAGLFVGAIAAAFFHNLLLAVF